MTMTAQHQKSIVDEFRLITHFCSAKFSCGLRTNADVLFLKKGKSSAHVAEEGVLTTEKQLIAPAAPQTIMPSTVPRKEQRVMHGFL